MNLSGSNKSFSYKYLLIALGGVLLFFPFLGAAHLFDWDEVNFAECAREMIVTKDYVRAQIDFMPFWEKPPLFIWLQVLCMKMFGVGAFAARLPDAITGVATLVLIYHVGRRTASERMAIIWAMLYAATWLPHLYFKSGIIDPVFNFFIFLSFYQFWLLRTTGKWLNHALLGGLFLGLAVLTKGPVAILVAALSLAVYIIWHRGLNGYKPKVLVVFAMAVFVPFLLWMAWAAVQFGWSYAGWFLREFLSYQVRLFRTEDSDHGGPFYYHFVVLLVGCFPASVFLFGGKSQDKQTDFTRWMQILFWVVLILFSIVKTKIVHYSSLCYFPMTYLAAIHLCAIAEGRVVLKKAQIVLLYVLGILWALVLILLPVVGIHKDLLQPLIGDPFAVANLQASVVWSYADCIPGILYLIGLVVGITFLRRQFAKGLIVLAVVQILAIEFTIVHFTPKIEAYSQRAAIDFYSQFAGKDVYIQPVGFKSYANLFYAQKTPAIDRHYYLTDERDTKGNILPPHANQNWLLSGTADRPVYLVCKIYDAYKWRADARVVEVGAANGFVFFKRK